MGEKIVLRQKVAHENAWMTFDKSQYERADTEREQINDNQSFRNVTD
jgi:hypothetical protein